MDLCKWAGKLLSRRFFGKIVFTRGIEIEQIERLLPYNKFNSWK
jgi:hypothetical protein